MISALAGHPKVNLDVSTEDLRWNTQVDREQALGENTCQCRILPLTYANGFMQVEM